MIRNKNKITAFNIASTIILQGLAFFSGPIFSGLLGTDNYGVASVYLTWVQLASTVFSLQAGGTIAIARVNFPEEEQLRYQSSVLCLATLCYMGFSVLTIFGATIVRQWTAVNMPMIILGLTHGWGMYVIGVINSKFTYEFKADKNFILSITVSALTIGLSILLIRAFPIESNYWGRIIGQSGIYTVVGLVMFVYVLSKGKAIYQPVYWKFTLPIAIPTIFHLLASIVLNQSDKVMVQGIVSNAAAGIYALAATFGMVLNTIWGALNNSWVPFYYEYSRQGQIDEMKRHAKNYVELFTLIAVGFILLSREVFHIYAKETFWPGTDLIPLFSVGYYFVFLYSFPVNYEFYNKKTKTIAVWTAFAAICNIVLNYVLIKVIGFTGAVVATVAVHALQFVFHYISAKKISSGNFPFKIIEFMPGFIAVAVSCVVYLITKEQWYIRWGIGALLGAYMLTKIVKRREIF